MSRCFSQPRIAYPCEHGAMDGSRVERSEAFRRYAADSSLVLGGLAAILLHGASRRTVHSPVTPCDGYTER